MASKRYRFHCVAPGVEGPGSTDDLNEAIAFVTADYYGSHFDIWDSQERRYVDPGPEDRHDIHVPGTLQTPPLVLRPRAVSELDAIEDPVPGQLAVPIAGPMKGQVHVYLAGRWRLVEEEHRRLVGKEQEQGASAAAGPMRDRSPTAAELRSVLLFLNRCRALIGRASDELRWMDATNAMLQQMSVLEGRSIGEVADGLRDEPMFEPPALDDRMRRGLPPIPPEARWDGGTGTKS